MQSERAVTTGFDPLVNQIVHFRRVILGQEPPLVSGAEGTKSLAVIDAIQRAAITQKLVQLDVSQEKIEASDTLLTEVITSTQ
jgi:predicted dehydrogenase